MNKAPFARCLIGAALALAIVGCGAGDPGAPPLADARIGGAFVLTASNGHPFSSQRLRGRYPISYFGYTSCPDACPTDLQVIGAGLHAFEKSDPTRAAKVQPLFVSVDPARDTPDIVGRYAAAFHPRMIGLTGTPPEIDAVAKDYGVFFRREPIAKGETGYRVDHSRQAVLFGPDGKPIVLLPVDQGPQAVAATLGHWVR